MEKLTELAPMAIFAIAMDPAGADILLYAMLQATHVTPRLLVVLVLVAAEVKCVVGQIQCAFLESVQSVRPEQVTVLPRHTAPILVYAKQMVHV